MACLADAQAGIDQEHADDLPISRGQTHNVRVRTYRKRAKEFSALYTGQDIIGHKGAVLTMKFSPDGELLASAGKDGVVRVWQVIESERSDLFHISDVDPSHVYFTINHLGELVPINVDKEKRARLKTSKKSLASACVIFPQKAFQLAEKPLHEFSGHEGEVLDLSWSPNKVGHDTQLAKGLFCHSPKGKFEFLVVFTTLCSIYYHLQMTKLSVCGELDLISA